MYNRRESSNKIAEQHHIFNQTVSEVLTQNVFPYVSIYANNRFFVYVDILQSTQKSITISRCFSRKETISQATIIGAENNRCQSCFICFGVNVFALCTSGTIVYHKL